jgi:hypothetical protein
MTALVENDFLSHLDTEQLDHIADCMYSIDVDQDCLIIREGDNGSLVYVIEGTEEQAVEQIHHSDF